MDLEMQCDQQYVEAMFAIAYLEMAHKLFHFSVAFVYFSLNNAYRHRVWRVAFGTGARGVVTVVGE